MLHNQHQKAFNCRARLCIHDYSTFSIGQTQAASGTWLCSWTLSLGFWTSNACTWVTVERSSFGYNLGSPCLWSVLHDSSSRLRIASPHRCAALAACCPDQCLHIHSPRDICVLMKFLLSTAALHVAWYATSLCVLSPLKLLRSSLNKLPIGEAPYHR